MRAIFLWLAAGAMAYGQPVFEAASVKLSTPNAPMIGCKSDPGTWTCTGTALSRLIVMAWDLPVFMVKTPDWAGGVRVDISARIPPGTSKDDLLRMQQAMLTERFKLRFHYEPKEMPVSVLTVAKAGILKEAQPQMEHGTAPRPGQVDADGCPVLAPGMEGPSATTSGRIRWQKADASMEEIVKQLALLLGGPVVNETGLKKRYDISLCWYQDLPAEVRRMMEADGQSTSVGEGGPTVRQALQSQAGLKVESKKAPVKILVVDYAERVPVEN